MIPFPVKGDKPGLQPPEYIVPAARDGKHEILVVKDGVRGIYLDHDRGSESVRVDADIIARSIVEDYVKSQPASDPTAGPGLFWVKEALTKAEVAARYPRKIAAALKLQHNWWTNLVRLADDLWTSNHKMAQIGDLDREACRQLALKRDWLDDAPDSIMKCPVCTTLVSIESIICFACHVVLKGDQLEKYEFFGGGPVQAVNSK
ncbi:hypothetical protein LCGC14_0478060 [marine sediment metagenome]|uniref:Uncharacterized protein n=1 Tax=marine sediment metagenome TaxID=412755 RepID=A0A0F9UX60_9ZZZZ